MIELASIQPLTTRLMSLKSHTMLRLSSDAGADLDLGDRVVAVRMLADAVVVEQPVAVAELDLLVTEYMMASIILWSTGELVHDC